MIDTWSEDHRHQCEVRDILTKRVKKGSNWAWDYLDKVEKSRGRVARLKLEKDVTQQWILGNRGMVGLWIDPPVA
jgi:hypothetical protein